MKKKGLWIGIAVVILAIVVGVFVKQKPGQQDEEVIKIGAILPLTGPASFAGELAKMGFEMAIADLNSEGIRVKILYEDSQGDPKTAVNEFRTLVTLENVPAIITTMSSVSLALKQLADKQHIVLFANASHPEITQSTKFVFRFSQTVDSDLTQFVTFLKERQKYQMNSIVTFYQSDEYGDALVTKLKSSASISNYQINFIPYDPKQADFRSIIAKEVRTKNPQLVVVLGFTQSSGILIKQLREYGFTGDIYAALAFILTNSYKVAGDAAEGVYHPDFEINVNDQQYKSLQLRFKSRFDREMHTASWIFYNNLLLLGRVMNKTGNSPAAIAGSIREMKTFYGVGGEFHIQSSGDIVPKLKLAQWRANK